MLSVFANLRSICHAGSNNVHTCAIPDVCKTPSPGGPIPIPYPNIAKDGDLTQGAKKTKIGGNPIAIESSKLATSSGDEAGTAGGVMSSKFKGAMKWASVSLDVKVEGKGVARLADVTQHNGNTFNSAFIAMGGTGYAYGDDVKCTMEGCGKSQEAHRVLETEVVVGVVGSIFTELDKLLAAQRAQIQEYLDLCDDFAGLSPEEQEKQRAENHQKRIAINSRLAGKAVLRKLPDQDPQYPKAFAGGYMVGVAMCKCDGQKPKVVIACSGKATPGFEKAVKAVEKEAKNVEIKLQSNFSRTPAQTQRLKEMGKEKAIWECAAPKLLEGAGGHRVKSMSERWYSPFLPRPVVVTYHVTDERIGALGKPLTGPEGMTVSTSHYHGATVPSCEKCQNLVPLVLCDNAQKDPCK